MALTGQQQIRPELRSVYDTDTRLSPDFPQANTGWEELRLYDQYEPDDCCCGQSQALAGFAQLGCDVGRSFQQCGSFRQCFGRDFSAKNYGGILSSDESNCIDHVAPQMGKWLVSKLLPVLLFQRHQREIGFSARSLSPSPIQFCLSRRELRTFMKRTRQILGRSGSSCGIFCRFSSPCETGPFLFTYEGGFHS